MTKQRKLMVLGASTGQLPIICKAVELGCYVITVDYLPDNVGHQLSQHYVNCSTVDQKGVLQAARELDIDGIVTFASDVATATVAFVSAELGLTGCSIKLAEIMSNKANFRAFQRQHRLNRPGFFTTHALEEIEADLLDLRGPLMFKPVDTSGSRGITRVDVLNQENCRRAFAYAQSFARSGKVCVEEFIEGVDVSGDGFMVDGQLRSIVTQKYKRGYVPTGHSLPTNIPTADQMRISAEVTKTCQALGYCNGPIDFDVKVSPEQVVVIEMSPRLGGNGIPKLIQRATGVDLINATVQYALGNPSPLPPSLEVIQRCGSWVFGSEQAGRLEHIAAPNEVRKRVPELFDYVFNYQIGDTVPYFEHSGNSLGYALFDCPPDAHYCDMIDRLQVAMQLRIVAE